MLVSHEHRFIFVKTRKTAGTSVEIALSPFLGPADIATHLRGDGEEDLRRSWGGRGPQNVDVPFSRWRLYELYLRARTGKVVFYDHMPAARIRRLLPGAWREYHTFTIERNPYDAAVSAYYFARRSRRFADMSLSDFLASSELLRYSNWSMYTVNDALVVDAVLMYEHLEEDLDRVRSRLNLPPLTLPHAKGDVRTDRSPYREVLSAADRGRIEDVYAHELDHFKYVF
jgi:hypothetical protein